jgi:GMP synthase-like glutamine amidotransferase
MKIGILQCGHAPDLPRRNHGDFDAMFARILTPHKVTFETYNVVDDVFPTNPHAADAWLLTGSKHGAYENHAFIKPLEVLIRDIHASPKRMVGICFGHQIVAQALGGTVEKFTKGWAIGRTAYDFDALGEIHLNAWHQDQVTARPPEAKVIARNAFCENAGLLYGDSILTVQPHPEISPAIIADYLTMAQGDKNYPPELITQALRHNNAPTDDAQMATMLVSFLKSGWTA